MGGQKFRASYIEKGESSRGFISTIDAVDSGLMPNYER
jgi:hypothetical protein